VAVVAGLEAGLAGLGDVVAQGVAAPEAGHVADAALAVPSAVVVVD
jgi:hypothetical protein